MVLIDANCVLRYLLQDIEEQFLIAKRVIEKEKIFIPDFIIAEVVYVLEKVYQIPRQEIADTIVNLLTYSNIQLPQKNIVIKSFRIYLDHKIDFADALLISYHYSKDFNGLYTFDKKILKIIS